MIPALRQYQHNDNGGVVFGFDRHETAKTFAILQSSIRELEKENKRLVEALEWIADNGEGMSTTSMLMQSRARHALKENQK